MFTLGSHKGMLARCANIALGGFLLIAATTLPADGQQKDKGKTRPAGAPARSAPAVKKDAPRTPPPAARTAPTENRSQQRTPAVNTPVPGGRSGNARSEGARSNANSNANKSGNAPNRMGGRSSTPAPGRQRETPPSVSRESTPARGNTGMQPKSAPGRTNERVGSAPASAGRERNVNRPPDRGNPAVQPGRTNERVGSAPAGAGRDRNLNRPEDRRVAPGTQPAGRGDVRRDARDAPRPGINRDQRGNVEAFRSKSGSEVRLRRDGGVSTVRSGDMTIRHGAGNSRRIVVERKDRTIISANRAGHGFVQRPFASRGHEFVNRTYYEHGRSYSRYYRPYNFHGVMLNGYIPNRFYSAGFYGWAYQPWSSPVYFGWGWMNAPWYGYYRGYFAPAAYYTSPGFWMADYILSVQLAAEYADRGQAAPLYGAVPLSPAVRQAIASEVDQQLALERAEAQALARNDLPDPSAGFPRLLSDNNPHVFVVGNPLDVADAAGNPCFVSRGDVLRLTAPLPAEASFAYLEVIAAKPGSCGIGATVSVSLEDLQDTYNQMRETISQGLEELRSRAGKNGVPRLPKDAGGPKPASFVAGAPPPDPQVAAELTQQVEAADRIDQEATKEAAQARDVTGETVEPITITLGQTIEEVVALMGNPKQIVKLGNKEIYVYADMKITFVGGKVGNVE